MTDENGEQWSKITNGVVGSGLINEENYSIYLESNYFRMPKELTIAFTNVEAIDKERSFTEFDFLEGTFDTTIENVPVTITIKEPNYLMYIIKTDVKFDRKEYFREVIDAKGIKFHAPTSTMTISQNDLYAEGILTLDIETPLTNPVRLYVKRFDQYLSGEASITVPIK